jgi:hypothetical protein
MKLNLVKTLNRNLLEHDQEHPRSFLIQVPVIRRELVSVASEENEITAVGWC